MLGVLTLLFILSGAAGLFYESVWSRYLGLFVGHNAYAQVIVLVIFLGGMALGAMIVGRITERLKEPLFGYAMIEAVVGLIGLVFQDVYVGVTNWAYTSVFPSTAGSVSLTIAKWGLAALLILPQSILLGATFPLMSAGALRRLRKHPGRTLSILYFANSFGAAVGVLIAGFYLVEHVGLPGTILAAAILNFVVAIGAMVTMKYVPDGTEAAPEPAPPEPAGGRADIHQLCGGDGIDTAFAGKNGDLQCRRRIFELEGSEALLGRLLQVLHQALVAGIVRNDQLKIGVGAQQFSLLVERQRAPMVGQRMDDDRGVLTRFDNFIKVTDGTDAGSGGQRTVEPARAVGFEQVAPDQIGGGHVLVAGDGDQGLAQPPGHVFDETRLAATCRTLDHHRQTRRIGRFVERHLVALWLIVRFVENPELPLVGHCPSPEILSALNP